MPRRAVIEVVREAPDGQRVEFRTSAPFRPGSVRVFLNGFALRKDFDEGWIEVGSQKIQMKIAPQEKDVLQVYYVT